MLFFTIFCLGIASLLYNSFFLLQVSSYYQVPQTSTPRVTIDIIAPICYNNGYQS